MNRMDGKAVSGPRMDPRRWSLCVCQGGLAVLLLYSTAATAAESMEFGEQKGWMCTQWTYAVPTISGLPAGVEGDTSKRWLCTQWTHSGRLKINRPPFFKKGTAPRGRDKP